MDSDVSVMLRQSAEDFLAAHSSARHRGIRSLPREIDRSVWSEMAELGWLGLGVAEELGGSGMGLEGAAELSMLFGETVFPEPFIAACVMPTAVVGAGSGSTASRELASGLIDGEHVLTLAWQERVAQLAPERPSTRLIDGSVRGCKLFVPAVERGGVLLVHVDTPEGNAIVAVSADDERVRCEHQLSGMGTFSTVHFDGAPTLYPGPLIAGDAASQVMRNALDCARIALSAQLTGVAKGALERTLRHVTDRIQFGRRVGSFQVIQHRCVNLHLGVQLAEASWRHALRTYVTGGPRAATSAAISAAKARSSDVALQVTRAAIQMHGAMGFTDEAEPGLYLRAALHGAGWLGTAVMHRRHFHEARTEEALDA